jgi:poly(hydroxyalkanoate) depolymerase family esterase
MPTLRWSRLSACAQAACVLLLLAPLAGCARGACDTGVGLDAGGPGGPGGDPGGDPCGDPGGGQPATCTELSSVVGLSRVLACVPAGMEGAGGAPAPLVVALHGYTQTAEEYKDTTEWHVLAGRYRFYVVFPQVNADLLGAGGRPGAWKWWRDYAAWTRSSYNQHFGPINAVVDAMKAAYSIDEDRVFVTGLSAGGYMTTLLLAVYPDVFAAGASFSGGPHNCDLQCTDSDKIQDWRRPFGYTPPGKDAVWNAYPEWWNDPATRKPRLLLVHGGLDEAVRPINLTDAMHQWTGALGIAPTPDNAALGEPTTLGGYAYDVYAHDGRVGVATVLMHDLGHGTPVRPGDAVDEGGHDPLPSTTAADCSNVSDPGCEQDWTNTGGIYGPYQAARFFGLTR